MLHIRNVILTGMYFFSLLFLKPLVHIPPSQWHMVSVKPVTERHHHLVSTKLFCLVTEYDYVTVVQPERGGHIKCGTCLSIVLWHCLLVERKACNNLLQLSPVFLLWENNGPASSNCWKEDCLHENWVSYEFLVMSSCYCCWGKNRTLLHFGD